MRGFALYDCQAEGLDELSFLAGAILINVTPAVEGGWYHATLQSTGKAGLVPGNYLRLEEAPTPAITRVHGGGPLPEGVPIVPSSKPFTPTPMAIAEPKPEKFIVPVRVVDKYATRSDILDKTDILAKTARIRLDEHKDGSMTAVRLNSTNTTPPSIRPLSTKSSISSLQSYAVQQSSMKGPPPPPAPKPESLSSPPISRQETSKFINYPEDHPLAERQEHSMRVNPTILSEPQANALNLSKSTGAGVGFGLNRPILSSASPSYVTASKGGESAPVLPKWPPTTVDAMQPPPIPPPPPVVRTSVIPPAFSSYAGIREAPEPPSLFPVNFSNVNGIVSAPKLPARPGSELDNRSRPASVAPTPPPPLPSRSNSPPKIPSRPGSEFDLASGPSSGASTPPPALPSRPPSSATTTFSTWDPNARSSAVDPYVPNGTYTLKSGMPPPAPASSGLVRSTFPPPQSKAPLAWLPPVEMGVEAERRYDALFQSLDAESKGLVEGSIVRGTWMKSGLETKCLAAIWRVLGNKKGLKREEFIVGTFLIDEKLRGKDIPATLPEYLARYIQGC